MTLLRLTLGCFEQTGRIPGENLFGQGRQGPVEWVRGIRPDGFRKLWKPFIQVLGQKDELEPATLIRIRISLVERATGRLIETRSGLRTQTLVGIGSS